MSNSGAKRLNRNPWFVVAAFISIEIIRTRLGGRTAHPSPDSSLQCFKVSNIERNLF
jgi:hypothetical protein